METNPPPVPPDGYYDVKRDFGAVGDGCEDDTKAIQDAFDLLLEQSRDATVACQANRICPDDNGRNWRIRPPYASGLYFPPGTYRITDAIRIGRIGATGQSQNDRPIEFLHILGGGARGGRDNGYHLPRGTTIRQDTDGKPIFVFQGTGAPGGNWGVTVEKLGFTWTCHQQPPPSWTAVEPEEVQTKAPTNVQPGAVALLFSRDPAGRTDIEAGYVHWRIMDCGVSRGWRGIAIDDTVSQGDITVFDTQIDHCVFEKLTGAAVSLVTHPATVRGMTNNSVRDTWIDSANDIGAGGNVIQRYDTYEAAIRVAAQGGCTLENLDIEGWKFRVVEAIDCVLNVSNLYLEHVEVKGLYPNLIYFGIGRYSLIGLFLDGLMLEENEPEPPFYPSFSRVINGAGGAEVVVSGVRGVPFAPVPGAGMPPRNPAVDGGWLPLNGRCTLIEGAGATYRVLDRPFLPVYDTPLRGSVSYQPDPGNPATTYTYEAFRTYDPVPVSAAVVQTAPSKAVVSLSFAGVAAHDTKTITVALPHAWPGDLVTLGPPSNLPTRIHPFNGVVRTPGVVEVTVYNAGNSVVLVPTGVWTLTVGGGVQAGSPQIL